MATGLRSNNNADVESENDLVPCPFCDKDIGKSMIARHLITHSTDTRPYKCSQCDKGFSKLSHLNRHMTIHSEVRPIIPCTLCSKSYVSHHGLKEHMMKMHSHRKRSRESLTLSAAVTNETVAIKIEQEQQQPAAEVKTEIQEQDEEMEITNDTQTTSSIDNGTTPMVTIYQNELLERVAALDDTAAESAPSKCDLCPICKQLIGKYGLAYHMLIHKKSVMKPYRCRQCKIGFPKPSNLANHIKRAHGESNKNSEEVVNDCAVCKKKYSSKSELELHNCRTDTPVTKNAKQAVATQETPEQQLHLAFKCDICEKIYRTTTGLEFHKLKLHRKEVQEQQEEPAAGAPFKCDKCHKELSTKKCFHVCIEEASSNVEEKKKRFQCGICKKVYGTRKALDCHNAKLHGIIKVGDRKRPPIKCEGCHKEFKSKRYMRIQHVCRGLSESLPVSTTPTKSKFICIRYL